MSIHGVTNENSLAQKGSEALTHDIQTERAAQVKTYLRNYYSDDAMEAITSAMNDAALSAHFWQEVSHPTQADDYRHNVGALKLSRMIGNIGVYNLASAIRERGFEDVILPPNERNQDQAQRQDTPSVFGR